MFGKLHVIPACNNHDKLRTVDLKIASSPLLFGWNETCGIRILRKQVAGEHASLNRDKDGKVWLVNLDSEHHTMLNGEDVREPVVLKDKDTISIAGREFIFEEVNEQNLKVDSALAGKQPESSPPESKSLKEIEQNKLQNTKPKTFFDVGEPGTNISQNSITNPNRERTTKKRLAKIELSVHEKVDYGWNLWILGSSPFLGDWKIEDAKPMQWVEGDVWTIVIEERENTFPNEFEYKYLIRHNGDNRGTLESGENRKITYNESEMKGDTPFYMLILKDDWNNRENQQRQMESFTDEKMGYTISELTFESLEKVEQEADL